MLGGRGVSAGHPCSAHALPRLLRYAAKRLYELCLGVVLCLTKPAFMRRPWRITPRPCVHAWALLVFVCNSTDSKQLRICGQGQKPRLRRVLSLITFYFYMCICCSLHSLICLLARTDASISHHTGYTSSALHFPVYSSA